ncbi:hypothetical protein [Shimia sp. SDUM112013]|uniref:hypothetical protein n=1 Tax=Shimia sp. SDUM112013 TaxID=3136160 RepID=UPI0032EE8D5E
MILLAAFIGIGSFLFHTFINDWTELADVVPIWSCVALCVPTAIHFFGGVPPARVLRIGAIVAAVVVIVFLASGSDPAHAHAHSHVPVLNGSLQYAPALISLVIFGAVTWRRSHPMAPRALAAILTLAASLFFRTVDPQACAAFPTGSHFTWHLLNGLMVGILLQALIRNRL